MWSVVDMRSWFSRALLFLKKNKDKNKTNDKNLINYGIWLDVIGDSKSYLNSLWRAMHKCVSLFWWNFLGTFWECRKVITHKCPCIGLNVYLTSRLWVVLHLLIFLSREGLRRFIFNLVSDICHLWRTKTYHQYWHWRFYLYGTKTFN